jgi:hypothetical protein
VGEHVEGDIVDDPSVIAFHHDLVELEHGRV